MLHKRNDFKGFTLTRLRWFPPLKLPLAHQDEFFIYYLMSSLEMFLIWLQYNIACKNSIFITFNAYIISTKQEKHSHHEICACKSANLSIQYRCQLFNKYLKRNFVGLLSTSFNSLVVIPLARNNKQLSHISILTKINYFFVVTNSWHGMLIKTGLPVSSLNWSSPPLGKVIDGTQCHKNSLSQPFENLLLLPTTVQPAAALALLRAYISHLHTRSNSTTLIWKHLMHIHQIKNDFSIPSVRLKKILTLTHSLYELNETVREAPPSLQLNRSL
jgi:hypothetical protein